MNVTILTRDSEICIKGLNSKITHCFVHPS